MKSPLNLIVSLSSVISFKSSSNGISICSSLLEVVANGMCSMTEETSVGGSLPSGAAMSTGAMSSPIPRSADRSSCSRRLSTAPLIWLEYFSNIKVSAFFVAASLSASASIIACSNMSDIYIAPKRLFVIITSCVITKIPYIILVSGIES